MFRVLNDMTGGSYYNAIDVSECCIYYAQENRTPISNLQLQVILYYIQAAFFAKFDRPCFNEKIMACKYGPVVEEVYRRYSYMSSSPLSMDEKPTAIKDQEHTDLIRKVCLNFANWSAGLLIHKTHQGDPWKTNFQEGLRDIEIPNEDLKKFSTNWRSYDGL